MTVFIEVHYKETNNPHFVNVAHIVDVVGNTIYTDDFLPTATDFPHIPCRETYEEIKKLIYNATHEEKANV